MTGAQKATMISDPNEAENGPEVASELKSKGLFQKLREDLRRSSFLDDLLPYESHFNWSQKKSNGDSLAPMWGRTRSASVGRIKPGSGANQRATGSVNGRCHVSEVVKVPVLLKEKIKEIAFWEKQIRLELEIKSDLIEKELIRRKEIVDNERQKLDQKDKSIRCELSIKEKRLSLNEDETIRRRERLDQKVAEFNIREAAFERTLNRRLKERTREEVEKLRRKFYEMEELKVVLNRREEELSSREKAIKRQEVTRLQLVNSLHQVKKEYNLLAEENETIKTKLDALSDYESIKYDLKSAQMELQKMKDGLKRRKEEKEEHLMNQEKEKRVFERQVTYLLAEKKKAEEKTLALRQSFQGKSNEWQDKYQTLFNDFAKTEQTACQLQIRNDVLSKELIDLENRFRSKLQMPLKDIKPTGKKAVKGCHSRDLHSTHEKDQDDVQKLSLDFVKQTRECIHELQRETQLIGERNRLNIHLLSSTPLPSGSSMVSNQPKGHSYVSRSTCKLSGQTLPSNLEQSLPSNSKAKSTSLSPTSLSSSSTSSRKTKQTALKNVNEIDTLKTAADSKSHGKGREHEFPDSREFRDW